MKRSAIILIVIGVVVFGLIGWVVGKYNTMVTMKVGIETAWSNIETQYQRRVDLFKNLESVTEGSADFEKSTLTAVTNARSAWAQGKANNDRGAQIEALDGFNSAISRLLVTVEAYPNIKSTESFIQLSTEVTGTENRVQQSRRSYNEAVKNYNTYVRIFPNNVFAGMFQFKEEPFFKTITEDANIAPDINFDFNN